MPKYLIAKFVDTIIELQLDFFILLLNDRLNIDALKELKAQLVETPKKGMRKNLKIIK